MTTTSLLDSVDIAPTTSSNATQPRIDASTNGAAGMDSALPAKDPSSHIAVDNCKCSTTGRNLIVCIDGTANQFSKKVSSPESHFVITVLKCLVFIDSLQNSNVVEFYSRLVKDKKQLTYYDSGIATYVKDSWSLSRAKQKTVNGIDMAVA
jgi:hypothetical protein